MKGTLRLKDSGWILEADDGTEVNGGEYPLREDSDFIESAAEKLNHWQYHRLPYERVDERTG